MEPGGSVRLCIEDLAFGGAGVARHGGLVVFVEGALPGEEVVAQVLRSRKNHATARLVEVLAPSAERVAAPCALFGECGGCTWQHLAPGSQLGHKSRLAVDVLRRLGGVDLPLSTSQPSPQVWRYRNKAVMSFAPGPKGSPILGFHHAADPARVVAVSACLLQPEAFDAMAQACVHWARSQGLTAWDNRRGKGLLQALTLRHSVGEGGYVATLVTGPGHIPRPEQLVAALQAACPRLQGFLWLQQAAPRPGQPPGGRERWRHGDPVLYEHLGGQRYRVSPSCFFQVNTGAAEHLLRLAGDLLPQGPAPHLLDGCCGVGTFALALAGRFQRVTGIEAHAPAVEDARANATGQPHLTFLQGTPAGALSGLGSPVSHILVDPPRGGLDGRSLEALAGLAVPQWVYVSCNAATMARDLSWLGQRGYQATAVHTVDLFPQTHHVELVVGLVHANGHNPRP